MSGFAKFIGTLVLTFVGLWLYSAAMKAAASWVCACEPADGVVFGLVFLPIMVATGFLISSMMGDP